MRWHIENRDFSQEAAADNGNRFLVANGYLGIRGTLAEHGKDQLAAVNLAGIYDRVGDGWREPLNAPNPLYTVLSAAGRPLTLPETAPRSHVQELDFYHGVSSRRTVWPLGEGTVTLEDARLAHMGRPHLILSRCAVTVSAPAELALTAEIDDQIWEIYGPHYSALEYRVQDDIILCLGQVQNGKDRVAVARRCTLTGCAGTRQVLARGLRDSFRLEPGQRAVLTSVSAVYTTKDCADPEAAALAALQSADCQELLLEHNRNWEKIWSVGAVELEGDDEARETLNYSLYHLNAIAPRHRDDLSIPARGLSGQTYKGAIFWDSEMFILDYFLYTQPEVARSMVRYRIETLPGALRKAEEYGWQGAFYAWESQEGGYDGCSDYNVTDVFTGRPMRTYFRDKQVHISAAVARAIMEYVQVTGDAALLAQGGARTVLECARFYYSLLLRRATGTQWEIHDVIGPDEYHERVNNNAYTNKMAQATLRWAVQAAALLERTDKEAYGAFCREADAERWLPVFARAAEELKVPAPDGCGVIEQFDGYFAMEDVSVDTVRGRLLDPREYWGGANGVASHTQVIKQADVVAMLEMFHGDYSKEVLRANWDYYAPRTEHGSSLSACMYALLACRFGGAQAAYPFFRKSARADWDGGGKQWAGLVYIGGTHPAAAGGAWKVFAQGFAGMEAEGNSLRVRPCLPEGWRAMAFQAVVRGQRYRITIDEKEGRVEAI